ETSFIHSHLRFCINLTFPLTRGFSLLSQDALLSLGSVIDVTCLREVIKDAITSVLPKVVRRGGFWLGGSVTIPPEAVPPCPHLDAVLKQKQVGCNGLPQSELQGKPMDGLAAPLPPDKQGRKRLGWDNAGGGSRSPWVSSSAFLMDEGSGTILVAYRRVQTLQKLQPWPQVSLSTSSSQNSLAKTERATHGGYSDLDRKILQLCGKGEGSGSSQPERGLSTEGGRQTQSPCCCLLLVSEDNHQLFCQVGGTLTFGRLGKVVEEKKSITLQDISVEEHKQLHNMLGFEVTSMLCVPVISRATSQVVALACAFNKLGGASYTEADEHRIQHCFCYSSTVLTSTLAFQKEQKLKCECQVRGQLARSLHDVSVLLQEIITEARNLSNAEICSVFLLDTFSHELVAKVFDGGVVDDESYEIRIPADQGIAGHVATTGKILNIKDAYSHPLFYRGVDDSTGFRTRNILCFPIKNESHEVIGVAELVNKINGPWFSKFDEDLATAFSIYCGISIAHSLLYKKVHEAQYRSHVANEMMMYHMKVSDEEYKKLLSDGISPVETIDYRFADFTYTPRSLPEDDTPMAILSMLQDMNFINNYKMDRQTLARWARSLLSCAGRAGGGVVACRGRSGTRMLDLMRDIILATDLAHHLRIFKDLQKMAEVGYDPENKQHHTLLLCLLMTSCDLSDQTKGWKTTRKIAELIYKEFFSQGDLEKAMGNRPMEMMDREKAYIPELQISFMEHIAMPIYKLLQDLFPRATELYERVASNREQWTKVSHKFTIRGLPSNNSLDFLDEEYDLQRMDRESAKMNGCLDTEGHMETVAQ
uniref:Phosphodiesterase 2A n=1 Tax=Chelydra serpentina TaxID=8475 RepID=A0A8C3SQJ0_CHESE